MQMAIVVSLGVAKVFIGGQPAPVIGRVSMDSITVDVTDFNQESLRTGKASLIHANYPVQKWQVMSAPFPMR